MSISRWASAGLVAAAVINIGSYFTSAVVSHRILRDLVHQLRVAADNPNTTPHFHLPLSSVLFSYALSLLQLATQILLMIWLYRAATFAKRAGLPARHDPVWAWVGFLVPIVNFWFPYQVAADTTPPGHVARSFALRWWCLWMVQVAVSLTLAVTSYFSVTAALGLAAVGAVLAALSARYGRAMIAAVGAEHAEMADAASNQRG